MSAVLISDSNLNQACVEFWCLCPQYLQPWSTPFPFTNIMTIVFLVVLQTVNRNAEQSQVQNRAWLNFSWNLTAKIWWVLSESKFSTTEHMSFHNHISTVLHWFPYGNVMEKWQKCNWGWDYITLVVSPLFASLGHLTSQRQKFNRLDKTHSQKSLLDISFISL